MIRAAVPLLLLLAGPAFADTLYVSDEGDNVVHVIDAASLKETGRLDVGKRPRGIVLSPDRKTLYVAASDSNDIAAVDLATGKVTARLPSGPDPETFALSPDGKRLYVANENDNLMSIVDIAAAKTIAEVPVGGEPEGTAVSPDGRLAVQAAESSSSAHVIDAETGKVLANLLVDQRPRFVAFTPDGARFWVSSELRGTISVFDTASRKLIGKIDFQAAKLTDGKDPEVFVQPVGVAFTRDGKRAFVGLGRAKLVAEVDPATLAIVRTWPAGWRAWNLALSPDETRLYTANGLSGDVTAIDVVKGEVIGTVHTGGKPWGIVVAP
jgi:PQQ-dependent catabolism-associated beta-propeller protein